MLRQLVHIHGPLHAETDLAKHGIRWYLAEALFLTLTTAQAEIHVRSEIRAAGARQSSKERLPEHGHGCRLINESSPDSQDEADKTCLGTEQIRHGSFTRAQNNISE